MPLYRKKPVTIEAMHYIVGLNHNRTVSMEEFRRLMTGTSKPSAEDQAEERNAVEVQAFLKAGGADFECINDAVDGPCILINTPEGQMKAAPGDWIIRGVKGEFYPIKSDVFEATYEAV